MWDSPEARTKLVEIRGLIDQTLQHMRLVQARGTKADRAQAIGFGIEFMLGVNESFEFDMQFRNRIRVLSVRWSTFDGEYQEMNRFFSSTIMMLERFKLITEAV